MIFCNFISGSKLDVEATSAAIGETTAAAEAAVACASLGFLEGATFGTVNKLRRLMQVSSGKPEEQAVKQPQQQQQVISGKTSDAESASIEGDGNKNQRAKATSGGSLAGGNKTSSSNNTNVNKQWQLERKYNLSEIQQHNSLDDCWMVIFDKVYNITEFVNEHPGGDFILLEYAGRDATHPFLSSRHGSSAYKMLDKYWIGILVDEELYYSNNSSYCSVYSNLSWRQTPTLEASSSSSSSRLDESTSDESSTEQGEEQSATDEFSAKQQQSTLTVNGSTTPTSTESEPEPESESQPEPEAEQAPLAVETEQPLEEETTTTTSSADCSNNTDDNSSQQTLNIENISCQRTTKPHSAWAIHKSTSRHQQRAGHLHASYSPDQHHYYNYQQQYPFDDEDEQDSDDAESGVANGDISDTSDHDDDDEYYEDAESTLTIRGCHTCSSYCLRRYH